MPKMKTHKGAKKRFHITGTGKILRMKGPSSHKRLQKPKRVKRLFDEKVAVHPVDKKRIKKLIPYGVK